MHPEALSWLSCPACPGADLDLQEPIEQAGRIWSGRLFCPSCQTHYPIRQGIPRFVDVQAMAHSQAGRIQGEIARNFGDAWQLYAQGRQNPYTEAQFLDWIQPLTPADFQDRVVLDLGSGLAGFAEFAVRYGPRHVIGLEISHAIDAAAGLLNEHPALTLVQGDILKPPFKPGVFDLIYSIGVLHHLDAPEQGFQTAATLLKPQGRFFIWVYGRENNALVVYGVDPLRKLASRLPVRLVRYGLALPLSLPLWLLLHTLYHPALQGVLGGLPYHAYFQWLRRYGFAYVWGMVTDQLIPPRTHYLSQAQLRGWFERAQLALESITPRNNISWRVLGKKQA